MKKEARLTVVGKVFKPNKSKVLALNKYLVEHFRAVKFFLSLNTVLIQTARDKAVEILKSFNEKKKEEKVTTRRAYRGFYHNNLSFCWKTLWNAFLQEKTHR